MFFLAACPKRLSGSGRLVLATNGRADLSHAFGGGNGGGAVFYFAPFCFMFMLMFFRVDDRRGWSCDSITRLHLRQRKGPLSTTVVLRWLTITSHFADYIVH
jgi:hypothetical protein